MLLRMHALTVSGTRWCDTGCYSIKYINTGVEGHSKARQQLEQGIPVLQCIPSYHCCQGALALIYSVIGIPTVACNKFYRPLAK